MSCLSIIIFCPFCITGYCYIATIEKTFLDPLLLFSIDNVGLTLPANKNSIKKM